MHFRAGEVSRYFHSFLEGMPELSDRDAVFFVPAPLLPEAVEAVRGRNLAIGAQNIYWEDSGAFTGEVSGPMVTGAGASHCLVGHSERRLLFGDDAEAVVRKLKAVLRNALLPVLCVGERIEERRAGRARDTVMDQLRTALRPLAGPDFARLAVAYEPVWAIGTGETATPEIAAAMHETIRAGLRELAGQPIAESTRILYGGSVTPSNIDRLMEEPGIDGVLVGGASLKPESFRRIVEFGRGSPSAA